MKRCGWHLIWSGTSLLPTIYYLLLPPRETNTVKVWGNAWRITYIGTKRLTMGKYVLSYINAADEVRWQINSQFPAMFPDFLAVLQSEEM